MNGIKQINEFNFSNVTGSIENTGTVKMGNLYGWRLNGIYDDIRFYNYALDESKIKELALPKILHYKFDSANEEATTNLISNPTNQVGPTGSEFIQLVDLAPFINTYGTSVKYSLSLDIKSSNTSVQNTAQVYMQNGSSTKYSLIHQVVTVTEQWQRFEFNNLTAGLSTPTDTQALLALYGVYGTGNFLAARNIQFEVKDHVTGFTIGTRTGAIVKDHSLSENNGTVALATTPKWSKGDLSYGKMSFGPTTQSISIPNQSYPALWTDPFSISLWIYVPSSAIWTTNPSRVSNIIARGSYDGVHGICREVSNNSIGFRMRSAGETSIALTSIERDKWFHIVGTWDGSQIYIYNNGVQSSTTNGVMTGTPGNTNWNLGGIVTFSGSAGNAFEGSVDEVQIFRRALTQEEVNSLYKGNKQIYYNKSLTTSKITMEPNKGSMEF